MISTRKFAATMSHALGALVLLLTAALLPINLAAQSGPVARIPIQVVAGKLLVRCDISTVHRRLPVNLFIELETKCALELHNQAANGLRCEREDGTTIPITLHFGTLDLVMEQREHGDEDFLDDFTKWNSIAMGETAVVGKLGSNIWKDYHLTFDLEAGLLELRAPAESRPSAPPSRPGEFVLPMSLTNDQAWLPVRLADGTPRAMALGTAEYDTTIDEDFAESLGFPAGNIGGVRLGGIALDEFVAFRPIELNQVHGDGALGVLGINLLENFRVSIDRVNGFVTLRQVREPKFPDADLAFFKAMVEEETQPLIDFLGEHGEARLAQEAAELLLDLSIDFGGNEEDFTTALTWIDETTPEDLRCTSALAQMKRLKEASLPEALILAGEIGLPGARKDRYPDAVHKIHAGMGRVLLESGDDDRAWKHLLSAAFGMKEDGRVNLDLGRFYERQGRLRRAESRFVQALIDSETGAEAFEGLARVRAGLGDAEPLSFDEVERRIEGKIVGFGAATRYEPPEEEGDAPDASATETAPEVEGPVAPPKHVALVELFTNPNKERAGIAGGVLAFEGLRRHFEDGHAAFLTYHTVTPELVPLASEIGDESAFAYELDGPGVVVIDGVGLQQGACRSDQVQELYEKLRGDVGARLKTPAAFTFEFEGQVEGAALSGSLKMSGPAQGNVVIQIILAERGVLFPGRSGAVLHRMVARTGLTTPMVGLPWTPEADGTQTVLFTCDTQAVSTANVAWLTARSEEGLGLTGLFGTAIDPRQITLVAIARDVNTNEVLQALEFTPVGAEPQDH